MPTARRRTETHRIPRRRALQFEPIEPRLLLAADLSLVEALTLTHDDLGWQASKDDQSGVDPTANESARLDGADLSVELPRGSWTMVRLAAK